MRSSSPGGLVVAHAVDLVVVGPELAGGRMEVHADRIAQAVGVDLALRPILVHADDAADALTFL